MTEPDESKDNKGHDTHNRHAGAGVAHKTPSMDRLVDQHAADSTADLNATGDIVADVEDEEYVPPALNPIAHLVANPSSTHLSSELNRASTSSEREEESPITQVPNLITQVERPSVGAKKRLPPLTSKKQLTKLKLVSLTIVRL